MKASMILPLIACCLFGQEQPQSPRWLRVGLTLLYNGGSLDEQFRDVFTRQLRKLGDVQVVPLDTSSRTMPSPDVILRVLIYPANLVGYAIAVVATRPLNGENEVFAGAWLDVAVEKSRGEDFETTGAKLIRKFDHEVLEADRKRMRFPEPQPPPSETQRFGTGEGDSKETNHCDIKPSLIHKVEPEYTNGFRKAKYQGTVVLAVEVDPTGSVVNPRVVRGLGLGPDEKAIEAARKWRFRPGSSRDGKSVSCEAIIEVNFRLL